jgi:two-component system phosphate regulon response regulator PhoB
MLHIVALLVGAHPGLWHGLRHIGQVLHAGVLLLASQRPAARLATPSLLSVRFGGEAAHHPACVALGAQALAPTASLRHLRQGYAWAALVQTADDALAAHDWLRRVRAPGAGHAPVLLMLTGSADDAALLAGLRAGADAALPAHASAALIGAQLDRLRQRFEPAPGAALGDPAGLHLDAHTQQAWTGHQPLSLKPQVFRLLWCLMAAPQRVFSLPALHAAIGADASSQTEAVHAYVSRLRKALRPHGLDGCIQTVHSVGYRYAPAATAAWRAPHDACASANPSDRMGTD